MSKYVTITEIARRLGISHSTVSRALNNHPRISKATSDKVKALAEELGYLSNESVKNFTQGKSYMIGVLVPDLSIPFFAQVLQSIQKTLAKANYSTLFFDNHESASEEMLALQKCMKYRVDGVISALTRETLDLSPYQQLINHEVPLVFYDRVANFIPATKVIADDYSASFKANKYLLENGRKCIAHITGTINLNNSNNRLYGYLDALSEYGLKSNEDLVLYYEFKPTAIDSFLKRLLKKYPLLDGISTFNDYTAYYAIQALNKLGKRVPEDIAVIGFSDEPIASYMSPRLSTVEQVSTKMGYLAATKMLSAFRNGGRLINEKIMIEPKLIIRQST